MSDLTTLRPAFPTTEWWGHYGVVTLLGRGWVLKKPSIEDQEASEMEKEKKAYEALKSLQGVIIPLVKTVGNDYLVLQHIKGQTLQSLLKSPDTTPSELEEALEKTVAAIIFLHSKGWCHGDFHGGNVIVAESQAWLIDLSSAWQPPVDILEKCKQGDLYRLRRTSEGVVHKAAPWKLELLTKWL